MKTITFLKRLVPFVSFLFILCVLVSCDQNKKSFLKDSKEMAMTAADSKITLSGVTFKSKEQFQSRDTYILLTIDTKTINQNNIDSKVVFSDDRSDPAENPGDPASFSSVVNKNMKVYWSGVAKDTTSGDVVNILGVYRKPNGGAEILESIGKDPNKNGVVVGKVKNKTVSGFEYYSVEFEINQDTLMVFLVDPKLKMLE